MKRFQLIVVIAIGVTLPFVESAALDLDTGGRTLDDVKADAVPRCLLQMGEFGTDAVSMCVESEHKALMQLAEYPDDVADIVGRCNRVMRRSGWSMIKKCSDRDIAARDALRYYPVEYAADVEACDARVGRDGYAQVQECVDARIAGAGESGSE